MLEWVFVGSGRGYFGGFSETKLAADLAGRGRASGLYGLAYLALKERGAKDWRTGLAISLNHRGRQHAIQSHHIFPRAKLRDRYEKREINEIANRAFVGGGTNRWFSDTPPSKYLPGVVNERTEKALKAQCVPTDPDLWRLESYPAILEYRRRELAKAINEFIDGL